MTPNRFVVALLFAFGLGGAILPVAANMDWQSTAGVLGGLGAICAAGVTWLVGWQRHEARSVSDDEELVQVPARESAVQPDPVDA
jgi:high-affinity Fe2+/Pb2+ permease